MALPVKLREVVEAMDMPVENWVAYINRQTGEIVHLPQEIMDFDDDETRADAEPETLADARRVEASDDFVQLPDRFDIHEYAIMERFCHGIEKGVDREDLLDAIKGVAHFAASNA